MKEKVSGYQVAKEAGKNFADGFKNISEKTAKYIAERAVQTAAFLYIAPTWQRKIIGYDYHYLGGDEIILLTTVGSVLGSLTTWGVPTIYNIIKTFGEGEVADWKYITVPIVTNIGSGIYEYFKLTKEKLEIQKRKEEDPQEFKLIQKNKNHRTLDEKVSGENPQEKIFKNPFDNKNNKTKEND